MRNDHTILPTSISAEALAYWYLRLNGFLTIQNFVTLTNLLICHGALSSALIVLIAPEQGAAIARTKRSRHSVRRFSR